MIQKSFRVSFIFLLVIALLGFSASSVFAKGGNQIVPTEAIVSTGGSTAITQTGATLSADTTDPGSSVPTERGLDLFLLLQRRMSLLLRPRVLRWRL